MKNSIYFFYLTLVICNPLQSDNNPLGKIQAKKRPPKKYAAPKKTVYQQIPTVPTQKLPDDLIDVDKILVTIYVTAPAQPGSDKPILKVPDIIITQNELDRLTIDGRKQTLDQIIFEKLVYFEAVYIFHFTLPEEAIDKYIDSIKEQYHLSEKQLHSMFLDAGYTPQEAREQFAMQQSTDALLNFKIRSRIAISEKMIRDFYEKNPAYEEKSYKIKKGFIPYEIISEELLKSKNFTSLLQSPLVSWTTDYWISEDEMSDARKESLKGLKKESFTSPEEVTGGFEIIKIITIKERALQSFEERYKDIMIQLQEPEYYKLLAEFKKELLEKYTIVHMD